jgi:hypothetical protein
MLETAFENLPGNEKLEEALTEIFALDGSWGGVVSILKREKCIYSSTHPSEIVTCSLPGNMERHLFIKYEVGPFLFLNDHRKSLEYEIKVYSKVLSKIAMSTPRYYGAFTFGDSNTHMLVLEYIKDLIRFTRSKEPDLIFKAARWLGEFHKRSKNLIKNDRISFIHPYDEKYFLQWPKKTTDVIIGSNSEPEFRWLLDLSDKFGAYVSELTETDPAIIHGEFYPQNVCYSGGVIYPLDWQTAALGASEIDFAALIHNWPEKITERCIAEYRAVRSPGESLRRFRRRVLLASVYLNFLWLGYEPKAIDKGSVYMDRLKELNSRL